MDAVKSFNAELSSLYEVKPPISKAKMTAITRGAIKAIKFYKHVVQSVEKFILKCKQEYKVPGLYVIDSIVRQSRHQFGSDKDVFAPRFAKNMQQTFINLFKCPPEDKSKIIRVLNLWQKNQVFAPDVIQPLFDLADPNHPIHKELNTANNGLTPGVINNIVKGSPALQKTPTKVLQQGTEATTVANIGGIANNANSLLNADSNTLAQLQQLHRLLIRSGGDVTTKQDGNQPVHFDKKLLDFDYDDDEEDDPTNPSPKTNPSNVQSNEPFSNLLSNPEVLRQLQTLQQSLSAHSTELDLEKLRKLQEMKQQEEEFDKHLAQTVPNLPFASECEFKPNTNNNSPMLPAGFFLPPGADLSQPPPGYKSNQSYEIQQQQDEGIMDTEIEYVGGNSGSGVVEVINLDHTDSRSPSPHDDRYNRRRRSRSRSRDRRRSRRSRSRSHSRSRRRRSRSRERERDREREKDREKEKERRKRGLPPIKKDNLSVCSTTLWVGHLSKLVHQEELSDTFGEFGDIVSIDLIPPRGCAFIVMHRRQDAARCLTKLKNHKMQGKAITLAWAPGKGVKGKDLKDYWEGDLGVSYIPYTKLKPDIDIELLEDGGMVDEDTMPAWLKAKVVQSSQKTVDTNESTNTSASFVQMPEVPSVPTAPVTAAPPVDTSQPPPVPGAGLLQPPPLTLPLVSPFQLNNRLIGLPPGMMPNVPIGVPPPNLPPGIMANQLLSIGSPFAQAPPPLLQQPSIPPQLSLSVADKGQTPSNEGKLPAINDSLITMSQTFGILNQIPVGLSVSHDDNMDVEMEDAEKSDRDRPPPLSDQLLASIGKYNGNDNNLSAAVSRLHAISNHRPNPGGLGSDAPSDVDERHDRHDDRNRHNSRTRDRDRDRDRNRDRSRRNSRERIRGDRDRDNRSLDRKDDRRNNRWSSDRRDRDRMDLDERREREKTVNDRLREMANESAYSPHDRSRDRSEEGPPSLLNRPFPPPSDMIEPEHQDRYRRGPPPEDFDRHARRSHEGFIPPPMHDRPDFDPRMGRSDFEPPPRQLMHRNEFEPLDRFGRRDRRDGFDERIDDFEHGIRRGPPGPPDFFSPGRDNFAPIHRPLMRGPGPDGFHPRPMMGRPPGPHIFHPRGPPMRGPRPPGPRWMDGGMRPNYPPRFEGPPEFFRGPPGPPGMFDEPHHLRHRRHEDRLRFNRPDFNADGAEYERPEKRSRWGNSPKSEQQEFSDFGGENREDEEVCFEKPEENSEDIEKLDDAGNTTPLHDEVSGEQLNFEPPPGIVNDDEAEVCIMQEEEEEKMNMAVEGGNSSSGNNDDVVASEEQQEKTE